MKSSEVFTKKLLPKIVLIVFIVIAYQILLLFPKLIIKEFLGQMLSVWLHLARNVFIIIIMFGSFPAVKELSVVILKESLKDKYDKWTDEKKLNLNSFLTNCLYLVIIFISYRLLIFDITMFFNESMFETLINILILITCIFFLYKAYMDLKSFLESKII